MALSLDSFLPAFFGRSASAAPMENRAVEVVPVENRAVEATSTESRSYSLVDPNFWAYFNLGNRTKADVPVTELTILGNSAFYSACRYISEGVAMLDRQVMRKMSGRVSQVHDHPVAEFLADRPHPHYTWFDLICALLVNALMGNGYARIWRDPMTMRPIYVEHLPQSAVCVDHDQWGNLYYRVSGTIGGKSVNYSLPPSDIIHIKNLSLDAVTGLTTTFLHADIHGTGIALNQYSAATLGNGAAPSLAISSEDEMSWADLKMARENFMQQYGGSANAGVPIFLSKGQRVEYLSLKPHEVGFEAFSRMNIADVARTTKMPLDLLAVENGGTYGAGVQRSMDFLLHCLSPKIEQVQEEFTSKLFYIKEQGRYSFQFDTSMYLALDAEAQAKVYMGYVAGSIMTPNEVREKLGLDPVQGGDELLTDINQVPLKNVLEVALAKYLSSEGEKNQGDAATQAANIEDAVEVIDDTKPAPTGTAKTDTNGQPQAS